MVVEAVEELMQPVKVVPVPIATGVSLYGLYMSLQDRGHRTSTVGPGLLPDKSHHPMHFEFP